MAALQAAWGLTHINMSREVGSKERAHRDSDKEREREIEGENRNK